MREAQENVNAGLRKAGTRQESLERSRLLLLKSEILLTLGRPADALNILDGEDQAELDTAELKVRWRVIRARGKTAMRDFAGASRLFDEALRIASGETALSLRAETEVARTFFMISKKDWSSAETIGARALDYARNSGDAYFEAAAFGNLGTCRLFNSRFDEAIPWYEQSIHLSEKHGFRRFTAMTQLNLSTCYQKLGDYDKALQLLSQAERVHGETDDDVQREKCFAGIGNVHLLRGDPAAAVSWYRKALALAQKIKDDDDSARWQNNIAEAAIDLGDLDLAEQSVKAALALRQKVPDNSSAVWAELYLARIAAGRNRYEEAETRYLQTVASAAKLGITSALLRGRSKLGSLYLKRGELLKAETQFQAIAAESESSRSKLGRDEWKLTFQSSIIPFYDDYVDFLMDHGRVAQALEVAESCRARLLAEKLGLERKSVRSATAADFRSKARAGKAVFLSYWLARRRSFVWVVTSEGVQWFALPPEKEISSLVQSYANFILQSRNPLETRNSTAQQLFQMLVGPARKFIPSGANVIVVPDSALHELNFETLLVSGEAPRYWIEDVTVTVAPSLAILQPAASTRTTRRGLLLMGNPVASGAEYPALPGSEQEIGSIQHLFPADQKTVLTGAQANPAAYREANPGGFAAIHFSAHAVANRESPLDSAVILSKQGDSYKLYARDVAAMPLQADLVTISACRSAGARTYSGEGLVGFTWAFLQAGARNVIAGLWDVNDRSTSDLMAKLYAEMANGSGAAQALRAAKLSLLRSAGAYQKPYYWAPFQLFTRSIVLQDHSRHIALRAGARSGAQVQR